MTVIETIQIRKEINSLANFKSLPTEFECFLKDDLEIEPFTKWSTNFAAVYWYAKYMVTVNEYADLEEEIEDFFDEKDLNFIWLTMTDFSNYALKCMDGKWELEIYSNDENVREILKAIIQDCQ